MNNENKVELIEENERRTITKTENDSLEMTKLLLENKADVNSTNDMNVTALMLAASQNNLNLAKYLLDNKATINIKNNYGYTALGCASYYGYNDMVKLLREYGATYDDNSSFLLDCVLKNNVEKVRELLTNGSNPNTKDKTGNFALYYAVKDSYIN
jgi:ankyrin repeat protein